MHRRLGLLLGLDLLDDLLRHQRLGRQATDHHADLPQRQTPPVQVDQVDAVEASEVTFDKMALLTQQREQG